MHLHEGQPKARMKRVWNKDEHVGKHPHQWYNKSVKGAGYNWSKGAFHGQSEGYKSHII